MKYRRLAIKKESSIFEHLSTLAKKAFRKGRGDFIEKPRLIFSGGGGGIFYVYYKKCLIQRYEIQITSVLRRTSLVYEDTEEIKRKTNSPTIGLGVYKSPNLHVTKCELLLTHYRNLSRIF